jgi:hypothetical protein
MSKGPATFRKSDFKRGIEAVELAGKRVARIEIDKTGKMAFIVDDGGAPDTAPNPWDAAGQGE